jgi:hypothetical protein
MTVPLEAPGASRPPDHPLGGGRDGGGIEERETRRLAARLAAAQRRLGEPTDSGPFGPSTTPTGAVRSELGIRTMQRLVGRLQPAWQRRRDES